MRIGHVLPGNIPVTHQFGGALERRALAVSDIQAEMGHEVIVFSANEPVSHIRESGVKVIRVKVKSARPYSDLEYLLRLRRTLKSEPHFDVLHCHAQPSASLFLAGKTKCILGQFDFFEFRGSSKALGRRAYKFALERFTVLTAVSYFSGQGMRDRFGLDREIHVLHNGVDLDKFHPASHVSDTYLCDHEFLDSPYALYVGRINKQKGSDLLPGIADILVNSGIDVVAAGPSGQFGTAQQDNFFTGSRVHYVGEVPDQELPGLMAKAQVLLLPTRFAEMFGMVLIEAGACGTPAVASNIGGIPEATGGSAVLVEAGDVSAFAAAVTEIVLEANLADASERALDNARKYSWEKIVSDTMSLYRSSTGDGGDFSAGGER